MFVLWWYKGRDPDPGVSVAPMYEPPAGFTPAEAGTLLEDHVHPGDITATLVDLAVRGYIKIEEKVDQGILFHHKDYIFHLLKPREQWNDLAPHELVMLGNVFAAGTDTELSSLKNRFYTALPAIRTDIMSALKAKGMYLVDPESANAYSVGAIVVILAPFVIAQFMGGLNVFSSLGPGDLVGRHCGARLVVVRAADDGKDDERRTHARRTARVSGVHESRGRRPLETHAPGHL